MSWFEQLTGFTEESPDQVRSKLVLEGTRLASKINQRSFEVGTFKSPTLADLRLSTPTLSGRQIQISELVADVKDLHQDPANTNAVFQVASQFNCLEMASPNAIPEDGVGIYENDWTQGPACSICAGAGTIYRNYFTSVNGQIGQSQQNQVDCLSGLQKYFGDGLWKMQNGYCFPTQAGLAKIENHLSGCSEEQTNEIQSKLQVGIQDKTQVTSGNSNHMVTQVFCSALPIAYSEIPLGEWEYFPRLILNATYEATFHVAVKNMIDTGCDKLYLTLVGGGVFGNNLQWILAAIDKSARQFSGANLKVHVVSYGQSNQQVNTFLTDLQGSI